MKMNRTRVQIFLTIGVTSLVCFSARLIFHLQNSLVPKFGPLRSAEWRAVTEGLLYSDIYPLLHNINSYSVINAQLFFTLIIQCIVLKLQRVSGKYPAILNISGTGQVALM